MTIKKAQAFQPVPFALLFYVRRKAAEADRTFRARKVPKGLTFSEKK